MDGSPQDEATGRAGHGWRLPIGRLMLTILAGGLLWLAWVGYTQPGLLLQLANLRYCG